MFSFEKFYLFIHSATEIGMVASGVVVDIFLWEQTHSLTPILIFNLGIFISWFVTSLFAPVITEITGLKIAHLASLILNIVFLALLYYLPELTYEPLLLGFAKGIQLGFYSPVSSVITSKIGSGQLQYLASRLAAMSQLVEMIIPPLMAVFIYQTGSYQTMLVVGVAASVFAGLLSLLCSYPTTDRKFSFSALLPVNDTNPEKTLLVPVLFLDGVRQGMFYSLLGIIILYFTNDLMLWGIFIFALETLSLVLDWIYPRIFSESDSLLTVGGASSLFVVASILFISYFNLTGVVILSVAYKILTVVYSINLETSVSRIIELDISRDDLSAEYAGFQDIYRSLGRIVPILALLYLNASLDNPFIIVGAIAVVGMVPFIMTNILSRSYVLKHWRDTIEIA
ncbi:hypothetical protein A2368_04040 [Candidatus Collierbacteria bacterium RIFOXYB1_FULL_49_13]|uniref:Major facilitator superfamily (MFS) profile domain-containing protein n=1 Tax=Candidatus Collierbacteria bacterium RIFOXYB1_FULL_49_13 TaxID=1817728 RepID=A0A1F5FEH6_9BACT|nr:MAG: hypothetical protein A2368_04040 [Candidatus Collierbacteria bacterium RIFOXYB1_FULL_49_13]